MRLKCFLCALFMGLAFARRQSDPGAVVAVDIDVNTGQATEYKRPPAVAGRADEEVFDAWPETLEFSGVSITGHEGEDAKESMGPRELILRAFAKLPAEVQNAMGLTALLDEAAARDEPVSLDALRVLWDRRQAVLKEASDNMSDSAKNLAKLIKRLEVASASFPGGDHSEAATSSAGEAAASSGENDAEAEALLVLRDLEEYLSDVDNARDFHDALGDARTPL